MSDARRTLVLTLLNLCYAWVLIGLAVAPSVPAAGAWFPDKLAHAMAYGGETVLLYWALGSLAQPLAAIAAAWLGTGVLGILTEILQGLQRSRSADPGDVAADMVGATIAIVVIALVRRAIPAARVVWRQAVPPMVPPEPDFEDAASPSPHA